MAGASSAVQTKRELGKATRDAFGRALEALGAEHPDVVVVDADVGNSTRTEWFGKKYPDRFFNIGIAESNLVGIAAGLASRGQDERDRQLRGVHHLQRLRPASDVGGVSRPERQGRGQPRRHLDRRGRRLADGDRGRRAGLLASRASS